MTKFLNEEKIVKEVTDAGFYVEDINDLKKIGPKEKYVIPIFLKHLEEIEDERDKEILVRALTVRGYKGVAPTLIEEFKKGNNHLYKWAIGNALCTIRDETVLDEMLELVKDKKHGSSRQMMASGLGYYKTEEVKNTLLSLLDDEDIYGHVLYAIGKLKDESTRKYVEPFLDCKVTWIRKEAKTIIKRLDRLKEKELEKSRKK